MKRAEGIFIFILLLLSLNGQGQGGIFVSHYLPGDYLSDNRHRIDIYNSFPQTVYIGGWILATRDYVVRFPAGTRIARESALRIGKANSSKNLLDVELSKVPDFLIKIRNRDFPGNFVVLFNTKMQIMDAFYYSPLPKVPFLPASDTLITFDQQKIPYNLPSEQNKAWGFVSMAEDPVIAFVQIDGKWSVTSAAESAEMPTSYGNLNLRYEEGIISLKWSTRFERQCGPHIIERSEDQQNFEEVARIESKGDSKVFQQYEHLIAREANGKTYYYRIRSEDIFGNEVVSRVGEIELKEGQEEFSLKAFEGKQFGARELNVRFQSSYSQRVKILLLDENLREEAVLFRDYVFADTPNLIKFAAPAAAGWYWILAETETRRFWEKIEIK